METGGDVKLLGLEVSSWDNRVRIALNLKGIPYEVTTEDIFNKSERLLASNPVHKKIPVLIHGDKPIPESLLIVQYIDEVWTSEPCILPSDPFDRSTARFWAAYVDNLWLPLIMKYRDDPRAGEDEDAKRGMIDKINEGFLLMEEAFVKCSKGKAFFGGDDIGFVDIALGPFWNWFLVIETYTPVKLVDETKTPNLCKWAQRFCSHEAVKDVLLEPPQLRDYFTGFLMLEYGARGGSPEMPLIRFA